MEIKKTIASNLKTVPNDYSALPFGKNFTDHMFVMKYKDGRWGSAEIRPYGPLDLDPAASSLHYGQEIFEGLKCYGDENGNLRLFRPEMNIRRMNSSAERMCMAQVDENDVLFALEELLRLEKRWVPKEKGTALYIRPTLIASEPFLGVHPAKEYLFFIILCPVGAYFKNGFNPIQILVEDEYVRAAPGGVGDAKTAGNYAASLKAGEKAEKAGFSQVLWLDAQLRKKITEVGAMNIAFVINDEIITPSLDGTILPGITRDSVLKLAPHLGYKITERDITIDEVLSCIDKGSLKECFGMGTAAVIGPVGSINYLGKDYKINNFEVGPFTQNLYDNLTGIQMGSHEDFAGWMRIFN